MNSLSKEKRQQLVLVAICTLGVLSGLWFGLIRSQQQSLSSIHEKCAAAERKYKQMETEIKTAPQVEAELTERRTKLLALENGMGAGDLYDWVINTIRQFKMPYKIDKLVFSQIDGPKDMSMIPGFAYKQASLTVGGEAFFHDFGQFVADFENQFPYFRVLNLNLEPVSGVVAIEREKLSFRMEIAVLVKPAS
jgi:hypothetical protein